MPWPMSRRVERQIENMFRMMERLEVDMGAAARLQHGAAFAGARTTCILCHSARECDRWLADAPDARDPSHYCPNMGFYASCRRG